MTTQELKSLIGCTCVKARRKLGKNSYRAMWSYFYRHGATPELKKNRVEETLRDAKIVDVGDHWHEFVGGAESGSAQDSFMWVDFVLP